MFEPREPASEEEKAEHLRSELGTFATTQGAKLIDDRR